MRAHAGLMGPSQLCLICGLPFISTLRSMAAATVVASSHCHCRSGASKTAKQRVFHSSGDSPIHLLRSSATLAAVLGRQVAAACIYLVCRDESDPRPFMLIDFSDALQVCAPPRTPAL